MNNDFKLKYTIADLECLNDYFSLQAKNEKSDEIYIYECVNDSDIKALYKLLQESKRPQYYYSIDYDKTMLNCLCKFVEKDHRDIVSKLRQVNDFIIQQKLNYFNLNRSFWVDHYFKFQNNDPKLDHKTLFSRSKMAFSGNQIEYQFIQLFPDLLGQSKVIKNMIINSIPRIMYYFSIRKDKSVIPTISLKNLQLLNEGYNIRFDFNKYTSIADIKKAGLYDKFIEYSKNDISSLEKIFLGKPKDDILKRFYAVEAVKKINPDFKAADTMLYSENNTELIQNILRLPEEKINKNIDIDYTKYIHTNYKKFNDFISFVNDNKHLNKDWELKENYVNYFESKVDSNVQYILDEMGEVITKINSFDEINIKNELNDIIVKIGLGGAHGALNEFIGTDLLHYDYDSQYPSIILQYEELFKNIINIPLYRSMYVMRNSSKPRLTKLEKDIDALYKKIDVGGNDGGDIEEYGPLIDEYERQQEYLNKLVQGLKLILNSAGGLINSNYNLPIACKNLGRFIPLKGQSLILNLCDELKKQHKISNVNTDGIICSKNPLKVLKIKQDRYFNVGMKTIDQLIQNDVNNYLAVSGNKLKKKGSFNLSIKQWINKNEKLAVNIENAIKLIQGKNIKIEPTYFDRRYFDKDILDIPWYFTTKKDGQQIIKNLKKPEIISIDNEIIYFTQNKKDANLDLYKKYAKITKDKILNFTLHKKSSNLPYFEEKLIIDTEENIKEKMMIKRKLGKIFGSKQIGFVGYQGKNKRVSFMDNKPVKSLIQYTMTNILKSTWCAGFLVENNKYNLEDPFIIIDVDIFDKNLGTAKKGWKKIKPLLSELEKYDTFQCWNHITKNHNKKYIFKNPKKIEEIHLKKEYRKYIEILDRATVYSLDNLGDINYDCNWKDLKDIPANIFNNYIL